MQISPVKMWRNQKKMREIIGKVGTVVSWTTIFVPPAGFEDQAPYTVVLVDVGGKRYMGQLVDFAGEVTFGLSVEAILRRVINPVGEGIIPYGIKFKTRG